MRNSKNPSKRRPYPEKYRRELAQRAQKQKPWEHTTGPKTPEGKTRSSANALKTGLYTAEIQKLRALLRAQKNFTALIRKEIKAAREIKGTCTRSACPPPPNVIPAHAGIHTPYNLFTMDPGFRRDDVKMTTSPSAPSALKNTSPLPCADNHGNLARAARHGAENMVKYKNETKAAE